LFIATDYRALERPPKLALTRRPVSPDNEHPAPTGAACPQPELCSLDAVKPGVSVRIKQLNGSAEMTSRLREMGFCEEQRIKLLMNHTNIICQVCNARLGISSQLAKSIMVEQIPTPAAKPKPT
jgi:Fe2+ transport system protein FeoA